MELRVLGCSGGIGAGLSTTSYLLNGEILIDAGSGVGHLTIDEMRRVKHIFLTHSHLDHVHAIPLLVDSIFDQIQEPITIHALPETIDALQTHVFNWVIWPDFSRLPHPDKPVIRFQPMKEYEQVVVGTVEIQSVPVNHVVPTVGYIMSEGDRHIAYSGDTSTNETLWEAVNALHRLDLLIVETAFPNSAELLSGLARHYCPAHLAADLKKLAHRHARVVLTHAKPGEEQRIYQEVVSAVPERTIELLSGGEVFTL